MVARHLERAAPRERFGATTAAGIICVLVALTPSRAAMGTDAGSVAGPTLAREHRALELVCTQCHSLELVKDTPKTYHSWVQTVIAMYQRGAKGTPRQFGELLDYLHRTLTIIDVNTADSSQLEIVLDVPKSVAHAIIERRKRRKFHSLADLESVPGVNPMTLKGKTRLIFFH